jgi:hypothetical protein
MVRVARRMVVLLAALAVVLGAGCLSPTLPLPPPSRPDTIEGPDEQGNVRLAGNVMPDAVVHALNNSTSLEAGQRVDDSGRYDFFIGAQVGDEILFYYEADAAISPHIIFTIPDPALR